MRLAVSNIAWDTAEDEAVAALLRAHAVDAIDVAPGKYFPRPAAATDAEVARVRAWWADRGIEITGMQALLFGTQGLNVFGPPESQEALLAHLDAVCRIAAGLGATRLVFGSPKNRDRSGLDDATADALAAQVFHRVGELARTHGVLICLEPNPARYGCNFLTRTDEAAAFVRRLGHPAIRLQLDTGALAINGEDPARAVTEHGELIGHVHLSEPDLVPLGDGATPHATVAAALTWRDPARLVSIEMLATKDEPHPSALARALAVAKRHYRAGPPAAAAS